MSSETLTMTGLPGRVVINPTLRRYSVRRYYDPAIGQFLTVDPAVDLTKAPYVYANGDPVNRVDANGLGAGSWLEGHVVDPVAGGIEDFGSAWWQGAQEAAGYIGCAVTQHPVLVAAGVTFAALSLASGGLGFAVVAGVLDEGAIGGLGSLAGLDAVHVGGAFLVGGTAFFYGALASFYRASGH